LPVLEQGGEDRILTVYSQNLKKLDSQSLENERLTVKISQKEDEIKESATNIQKQQSGEVKELQ
jgi:hypothetical protein